MKHLILFFYLIFYFSNSTLAQEWEIIGNVETFTPGEFGFYETLGEYSPKNCPSLSERFLQWNVNDESIFVYESHDDGVRFWQFDTQTKLWKCLSDKPGDDFVMGIKGVADVNNFPGHRMKSATWTDNEGNLWLFSGKEPTESGLYPCDLWKYDVNNGLWTWVSGDVAELTTAGGTFNATGMYEAIGVPSSTAYPSNLHPYTGNQPITLVDNNGDLLLFRGAKNNDLWRFDVSSKEWTWLAGFDPHFVNGVSEFIDQSGTMPERTTPTGKTDYQSHFWTDDDNNYYLLDGLTTSQSWQIWKFDNANGFWTNEKKFTGQPDYSLFNQEHEDIRPHKLGSSDAIRIGNELWFFGGNKVGNGYSEVNLMLKLNLDNWLWTWKAGLSDNPSVWSDPLWSSPGHSSSYGETAKYNLPSARRNVISWVDGSHIYYSYGMDRSPKYDIWSFDKDSNEWTLEGGRGENIDLNGTSIFTDRYQFNNDSTDIYYARQSEEYHMNSLLIDNELWTFHKYQGLIKRNPVTNVIVIVKEDLAYNIGTVGMESEDVAPHDFYFLYHDETFIYGIDFFNHSLFKFNRESGLYTCVKTWPDEDYGDLGIFSESNFPRTRQGYYSWWDGLHTIYLFGGQSRNDMWKYDMELQQWAWISGAQGIVNAQQGGIEYPRKGSGSNYWIDSERNLWTFGGYRYNSSGYLAHYYYTQMWKFDIQDEKWKIIKQGNGENWPGYYGTAGKFSIFNNPGGRSKFASWVDNKGKFWMVNGFSNKTQEIDFAHDRTVIEDVWMFDPIVKQWVWINGLQSPIRRDSTVFNHYDHQMPSPNISFDASFNEFPNHNAGAFAYGDDVLLLQNYDGGLWRANIEEIRPKYNIISGVSLYDDESDGCDTLDNPFVNLQVIVDEYDAFTFTDSMGAYYQFCNEEICTINTDYELPYFNITPASIALDFGGFGEHENLDYCVTPAGEFDDLSLIIIPEDQPQVGFSSDLTILYENKGTTTLSGEVKFIPNLNYLNVISFEPDTSKRSLDTFFWKFDDLLPFEKRKIKIRVNVNTTIAISDTVCYNAIVCHPGIEETPENNKFALKQIVVGSFDPNDKTISEGPLLPVSKIGEYVHYLIRFENLGTANARFVVLQDSLDEEFFDITSFQPLDWSHPCVIHVDENNVVEVFYENIDLPFDPLEGNKGYFYFKIKTNANLNSGDFIRNKADIYFDYNEAIVTEISESMFEIISSIDFESSKFKSICFPNPTNGNVYFKESVDRVAIINAEGIIVKIVSERTNWIDTSDLSSGVYYFRCSKGSKTFYEKIILANK